jgi:hypothetical protein
LVKTRGDLVVSGKLNRQIVTSDCGPGITGLLRHPGVRLLNVPRYEAYVRLFPYLPPVELREGLVDLQAGIPGENMALLATPALLGSRTDLHPPTISLWRAGRWLELHSVALSRVVDILVRAEKPDELRAGQRTRRKLRSDMNVAARKLSGQRLRRTEVERTL